MMYFDPLPDSLINIMLCFLANLGFCSDYYFTLVGMLFQEESKGRAEKKSHNFSSFMSLFTHLPPFKRLNAKT